MKYNLKLAANSTHKKLAVQWLNEALCCVSSSVVADSIELRNRQFLVAAFQDNFQIFSFFFLGCKLI